MYFALTFSKAPMEGRLGGYNGILSVLMTAGSSKVCVSLK
jgi:hypothetical protein